MSDCIFCRILAGEMPASFVHRDDRTAAFMDIRPVNRGHTLVIPVRHGAHLADLEPDAAADLMRAGHRIAAALRASTVRCDGLNLFLADGEVAGQEICHVHLHVVPRYPGDGFGLRFAPGYGAVPPRPELDAVATEIRDHLSR